MFQFVILISASQAATMSKSAKNMNSLLLTSIVPLFLLVGVALPGYIPYHVNTGALQPILTRSQERRICAELCMTGLGGAPCGDDCVDLNPQGLPLQSLNGSSTGKFGVGTRHDACKVLCQNQLGDPLCHCNNTATSVSGVKKTDFMQVCGFFCVQYDYQIYGCQACQLYQNASESRMLTYVGASATSEEDGGQDGEPVVDWDMWCQSMCQDGNGGAACNCDLLPMSLEL